MSGQGSNVDVILKNAKRYKNLNFVTICTDRKDSNAKSLSQQYGLEYFCLEGKCDSLKNREIYFQQLADYLRNLKIDTLIYAGFMKICPAFFLEEFPGINIHPSDLTIRDPSGKPRYVGIHPIESALKAGETYLASTVHVVESNVDCGVPIAVSKHLPLQQDKNIEFLHAQLKVRCEHHLYPLFLELMAQGLLKVDKLPYSWEELIHMANN